METLDQSPGYAYNQPPPPFPGGITTPPSGLNPTQNAGKPTNQNLNYPQPNGAPVISGTVQNSGAPGSGTSGPPGTPPAGTLGYESLIPYAGNAAYYGNSLGTEGKSMTDAANSNINAYTAALKAGISSDPTQRMAQAAPGINAVEAQTKSAVKNIETLPRGGAQDYLTGQAYISEASNVGDLINQAYAQDLAALGALGTEEAKLGMAGTEGALGAQATAASITGGVVGMKNQQKAANQASIANDIGALATLALG